MSLSRLTKPAEMNLIPLSFILLLLFKKLKVEFKIKNKYKVLKVNI